MKANAKYKNTGEKKVKKDKQIKKKRMREVTNPKFYPSLVQTPKAYCSKKFCMRFILKKLYYKYKTDIFNEHLV